MIPRPWTPWSCPPGRNLRPPRARTRLFPLLGLAALLLTLAAGADGQAGQKKKKPPSAAERAAQLEVKSREAEVLRAAYIFLAMANHNYAGHRAKAMRQVERAVEILDSSIFKNGTNGQKVLALQEDIAAARAKLLAKHSAKVHEPQALSNLQLREAGRLLTEVRVVLERNKQKVVLGHVDQAIKQIHLALAIQ